MIGGVSGVWRSLRRCSRKGGLKELNEHENLLFCKVFICLRRNTNGHCLGSSGVQELQELQTILLALESFIGAYKTDVCNSCNS